MRRLWLVLVELLAGCGGTSQGDARPLPREALRTEAPGILLRPEATGIRVSYRLERAEREFRFDDATAEIRKDTWALVGAGLSLTHDGLASSTPVNSFDLLVAPDSVQRDRVYPALSRVGEGWLVYAPHFRLMGPSAPARFSVDVPPGWVASGARHPGGDLVGNGYVYVGPASLVHRGAVDIVNAPQTPPWLVRNVEAAAGATVAFYERRLGLALRAHPTIVVTYEPDQKGTYRGDTTPGASMSLRFYGAEWREQDPALTSMLDDFLNHEFFHFWNGEIASPSDGPTRPWLHEGGANYAALLAARERGTMSSETFVAALNKHLERCEGALSNRDLRDHGPKRGGDTYSCGTLLHWAIDLGLRHTSGGERDALSWWKDVLAEAATHENKYSFEGSYALVSPPAKKAADVLLGAGDARRWTTFAEAARTYGADMVEARRAGRDLSEALDHLLSLHCGRDRGFFTFADHVKLDTGTRCGPLNGDPEIDAVAGVHPTLQPSAMHDEVRRLCAAGKIVELARKGKTVASVTCTTPLPAPTLGWQIRKDGG